MNNFKSLSRRRFLGSSAALAGASAIGGLMGVGQALAQTPLTVGFIYVGPKDDFGYNQAHAEGAAAVKAMAGVTVLEEENVPESVDVQNTMESMINFDGATLIFPTSFGYFNPHILEMAPKFSNVRFQHCGGMWTPENPTNIGSYFGYIGMGISERCCRRSCQRHQEDRLCRGETHSTGDQQHQFVPVGGAVGGPDDHLSGDLYRRMVDVGERGRGNQCAV